ncbi:MAG: 3-phosphoglycerate dehydrogenase [Cenarchaeum sp. SB0661_bin_35]|nr:3-phosphoglycerate dehydrogenase [Cenarchaeum sp. SB0667_bin_13]MYB46681.1 3-phosphoglycerate dehydrogenase [Cenarchaeum sp. SB0662_bin_33]MYC79561.1 3-phosphoglycerate dehydrogenase [Cenarchaeum sp. SB0661_bin_35]MYI51709.1 3-phosphoglycerate dehydrogenase [Cenarchaeum sp. SB0673_bin_9]
MLMVRKVLICDVVDDILPKILKDNGMDVDYNPEITKNKLLDVAKDYHTIVVRSRTRVTAEVIDAAKNCSIVARVGVGLDNIDQKAAGSKEIRVINAAEGAMNAVAELVMSVMLSLSRHIPRADRTMRDGIWEKKSLKGTELRGKYLGIVGLGNVGQRLGRLARAFNMNIIGHDVVPINPEFVQEVGLIKTDLKTLLQSSDYVSLHVPLLESTRYMINAENLSLMKKTAYIINTSRGGIVDEMALYAALRDGRLGGAALDVFENEPPDNTPLAGLDNVILTPHLGAQTVEAQKLAAHIIAEKLVQIERGVI